MLDGGPGRNAAAAHVHNVFTRDGTPPDDLHRIGREQAEAYGARFLDADAMGAEADADGVRVHLTDGTEHRARRLLLATGIVDLLPELPGLAAAWGRTAVHCPYCHGFELRGRPTVVLARGDLGFEFARVVTGWTDQATLLTNGPSGLTDEQHEALAERGIDVRDDRIERLDVDGSSLRAVVFASGEQLAATALYLHPPFRLRGPLPAALGVNLTEAGFVTIDAIGKTNVANVWACGDMTTPMQAVQTAATSGFVAAAMINHDLIANGVRYAP